MLSGFVKLNKPYKFYGWLFNSLPDKSEQLVQLS